jgi:hypothetical protein
MTIPETPAVKPVALTVGPTGYHSNVTIGGATPRGTQRFTLAVDYEGLTRLTIECAAGDPDQGEYTIAGYFIGVDDLSEAAIERVAELLRERLSTQPQEVPA